MSKSQNLQSPQNAPKPVKVDRKLRLSKEKVAQLNHPRPAEAQACTRRATGCPIHTC